MNAKPALLWKNAFELGTVTATDTETGYSVNNIFDRRRNTLWKGDTAGTKHLTVDLNLFGNPGLETGDGTDWTLNDATVSATNPNDGTYSLKLVAGVLKDIDTAAYAEKYVDVSARETSLTGVAFSTDGTKMYVIGFNTDTIYQYTLSTPWNPLTAVYASKSYLVTEDALPQDLVFKSDGATMFVLGDTSNTVYQYTLSTPWDISTASYASKSKSVGTEGTSPRGLAVKPDGTEMYVTDTLDDEVNQYTLGTGWDVSTASYTARKDISGTESAAEGIVLNSAGTIMYIAGMASGEVHQFDLGTPWDITSATFNSSLDVSDEDTAPRGIALNADEDSLYIAGDTNDTVYQYDIPITEAGAETDAVSVDPTKTYRLKAKNEVTAYTAGYFRNKVHFYDSGDNLISSATLASYSAVSGSYQSVSVSVGPTGADHVFPAGTASISFQMLGDSGADFTAYTDDVLFYEEISPEALMIVEHNLYTCGATIEVDWSDDATEDIASWTNVVAGFTPDDNKTFAKLFTSVGAKRAWRVEIATTNLQAYAGQVLLGPLLDMETHLRAPFDPQPRTGARSINTTGAGEPLSVDLVKVEAQETVSFHNVTDAWYRNTFLPAYRAHLETSPFGFIWDSTNHLADAVYAWLDNAQLRAPYNTVRREFSLPLRWKVED